MGRMRNEWFPSRTAEYVTQPELRQLRLTNTNMERDVEFGVVDVAAQVQAASKASQQRQFEEEQTLQASLTARAALEKERVVPARGMELINIFVPKTMDFFRQPIPEEPTEPEANEEPVGKGAVAELFAARQKRDEKQAKSMATQAIYGSVSTADVAAAVRAAMENNDESARVLIAETDIKFVDTDQEVETLGRVKHVGSFPVEIMIKGAEAGLRRTVRVLPQEA